MSEIVKANTCHKSRIVQGRVENLGVLQIRQYERKSNFADFSPFPHTQCIVIHKWSITCFQELMCGVERPSAKLNYMQSFSNLQQDIYKEP